MKNLNYQCPCCSDTAFYFVQNPKREITCQHCGFVIVIDEAQEGLLSHFIKGFYTRPFFFIPQRIFSAVLDGCI